jgi:hypothetical protein
MPKHFTKDSQFKLETLGLAAFCSLAMAIGATPAQAQGNTDLEVFGGGLTKTHTQGFNASQGFGVTAGAGSYSVRKDALEPVSWYKSRRQVYIEDNSPIVSRQGGGPAGGFGNQASLTPATFGGSGAMAGAMGAPQNLAPANFGPIVKPEQAQARPIMRARQGGLQSQPAVANAGVLNAPVREAAPANAASYSSYSGSKTVVSDSDFQAARVRDVKARLLGPR